MTASSYDPNEWNPIPETLESRMRNLQVWVNNARSMLKITTPDSKVVYSLDGDLEEIASLLYAIDTLAAHITSIAFLWQEAGHKGP